MTTLQHQLADQLERIAIASTNGAVLQPPRTVSGEWQRSPGKSNHKTSVAWQLRLTQVDTLGCRLETIQCRSESLWTVDSGNLLDDLVQRVCYLSEPLHVMEVEREAAFALARSEEVRAEEKGGSYFEFELRSELVTLSRFHAVRRQPRQGIDYCLTRETLGRLLGDMLDVIGEHGQQKRPISQLR